MESAEKDDTKQIHQPFSLTTKVAEILNEFQNEMKFKNEF